MRLILPTFLVAVIVVVECRHTFLGTNVLRPRVQKHSAIYSPQLYRERVENYFYSTPPTPGTGSGMIIQGILAYDMTNSGATANITTGGVGFPYVGIRMKSDPGQQIHYDIYIFA